MREADVEMDTRLIILIALAVTLTLIRFLTLRRSRRRFNQLSMEINKEINEFLANFRPSTFEDFSALDFKLGAYSHCAPFPRKDVDGELIYSIYLSRHDAEDVATITHELTGWTIGRLIEKLLDLNKPLYLQRKQEDKFWIHGTKQKYVLEHVLTTFSETIDTSDLISRERLAKEDVKAWFET